MLKITLQTEQLQQKGYVALRTAVQMHEMQSPK